MTDATTTDDRLARTLIAALVVLRVTLGLFLLQWGVEKFVVPESTIGIWGFFYGIDISAIVAYIFGAIEILIALCILLGLFRTLAYGAAVLLHAVSVVVSWQPLLSPWADPVNHLFIAGVPVLGALIALFLLRHWDRAVVGGR